METYISPFIFQVVRLYGSLNQFSYDIGKVVNNKYFYDCLIQVQEELVYGHKVCCHGDERLKKGGIGFTVWVFPKLVLRKLE